jgi:hypothetical protein
MSFHLSFHLTLLGSTGAYWLDDPFDLSCTNSTQDHAVDVEHQSTDLVVSAGCVRWVSDAGQRGSRPTGRPPAPT